MPPGWWNKADFLRHNQTQILLDFYGDQNPRRSRRVGCQRGFEWTPRQRAVRPKRDEKEPQKLKRGTEMVQQSFLHYFRKKQNVAKLLILLVFGSGASLRFRSNIFSRTAPGFVTETPGFRVSPPLSPQRGYPLIENCP
jgi:hypothetical protein